eukprot:TRINITY_DN58947_c0_g1_i2.p1 TRINITY_DN58947_c0_g1~~TRINITY_DN58947_c0_g1_i2.p1  ORF type:complete len:177 (-),score=18.52 TRINITY_DN58947_c0_g1_i2:97-627(-)
MQQVRRLSHIWMTDEDIAALEKDISAFPKLVQAYLSGGVGAGSTYGRDPRELMASIGSYIFTTALGQDSPQTHVLLADRMQDHISGMLSGVEEMAQLVNVAVAQEYSKHTSRFLTVYICALPFLLIEFGHLMPLAVVVISWALLGIEEIGHTLEDPFSSPTDPIPIQKYLEEGSVR